MSVLAALRSAYKCDAEGEKVCKIVVFLTGERLLIFRQTRRCLQCRRLQGVDMDPVRVVFGQRASADRLVILYTRWFMTNIHDLDITFLRRYGNVCYTWILPPTSSSNMDQDRVGEVLLPQPKHP